MVDKSGTVQMVFNDQFGPEKHVAASLEAVSELAPPPAAGGFSFELPSFELPSFPSFGKEE